MKCITFLMTLLSFFHALPSISGSEEECGDDTDPTNSINLFVRAERNHTGDDWVSTFHLKKDDSDFQAPNDVTLALSQGVTGCRGKRTVHIRGVLSGITASRNESRRRNTGNDLLFHTKCGSNVAVMNDGRTIRKINLAEDGNAVAFTRRPLQDNEMLEVKLEKKHNKFSHSLAIGVTTLSPVDASKPQHINSITSTSWAMYHGHTYYKGKEAVLNYGQNLNALDVGDRVGVMKSNTGSLHFFVNGVDQGPAASDLPQSVYGLVELWGNAAMATIVDY